MSKEKVRPASAQGRRKAPPHAWRKGTSGNPKGRWRATDQERAVARTLKRAHAIVLVEKITETREFVEEARKHTLEMLQRALRIARNDKHPRQLDGIRLVIAYAHGLPKSEIDLTVSAGINTDALPAVQQAIERLRQLFRSLPSPPIEVTSATDRVDAAR